MQFLQNLLSALLQSKAHLLSPSGVYPLTHLWIALLCFGRGTLILDVLTTNREVTLLQTALLPPTLYIPGLEENSKYIIKVGARNRAGAGPRSDPVTVVTNASGEKCL